MAEKKEEGFPKGWFRIGKKVYSSTALGQSEASASYNPPATPQAEIRTTGTNFGSFLGDLRIPGILVLAGGFALGWLAANQWPKIRGKLAGFGREFRWR